jgi:hypothetical protein
MTQANSHTHCQVSQANTQTKTWQRVCLFQRSNDKQTTRKTEGQHPTAVWRNGGFSASYDSYVVGSSAVLRFNFCAKNPPLRQAAKRWEQQH